MRQTRTFRSVVLVVALLAGAGCAAQKSYHRAEQAAGRENWDQAVLEYSKAAALDPGNSRYSVALERAKLKASADHFMKGRRYMSASQWDLAVAEFQQTLLLNPGNQHAATEMEKAMVEIRRRDSGPSDLERIKAQAKKKALAPPKLSPKSNIPIQLQFRDRPIGQIFDTISKASQINFIYDEKVDLQKPLTIDIANVSMEEALDILMLQTKNFYKVIDDSTLLIAPDQRQKRQELEDQVIRTFYLSNAETKQVVSVLRTLLNSRQLAENDPLNSVTIKDTPDKVAIAEKIIDANDKSKGEVIVDVELLEINRTTAQNLGIDLSSHTLNLQFLDGKTSLPLNGLSALRQQGNWTIGPIPSVILNFLKSDTDTKSLAKPQLRVTEGEKAEILIGQRVPIPATTFNTSQTVGGNIVPITSFTYQNVGITLQMEPRVHHNKEVTLKVEVEVSNLAGSVTGSGGVSQPIIGTRQIKTVIRLRDGETNLLAGLIKRDDSLTRTGVPGLMDIPGVGRVLSENDTNVQDTDLILTLTPYIIRIPDINEDDLATLWVGTEENVRLRGPVRGAMGVSVFGSPEEAPAKEPTTLSPVPPAPATSLPPVAAPAETTAAGGSSGTGTPSASPSPSRAVDTTKSGGTAPEAPPAGTPAALPPVPVEPQPQPSPSPSPAPPAGNDQQPAAGPATVRLVPSAPSYKVGDRVVVEVRIEGATGVGSVPYHLKYNRQVLEFVGPAAEGPFLGSDGVSTVFLANPIQGGGDLVVGHSRLGGGDGVSGSGTLATFQFQAINAGDCGFAFSGASVKDPQARNLPATFLASPVTVEP